MSFGSKGGGGKPELLLPPQTSKQEKEDKPDLNLPAHSWIFFPRFNGMHLCILSSTDSVQSLVRVSLWKSCHARWDMKRKESSFLWGLAFCFFLFAKPHSSMQFYLGIETMWYESNREQINVVFFHVIFLLANFPDLKQTFSCGSLQGINSLTCHPQMALCIIL